MLHFPKSGEPLKAPSVDGIIMPIRIKEWLICWLLKFLINLHMKVTDVEECGGGVGGRGSGRHLQHSKCVSLAVHDSFSFEILET